MPVMWLQEMPGEQVAALLEQARMHRAADPAVAYPGWYLRRWHFLPEGYLSARSVALYDRVVRRVYWAGSASRAGRVIARWLERTGARRVLEVGPGPGRLVADLRKRLPNVEFRGIDLSPYFVEVARERLGSEAVIHGDARDLSRVAGVFDAVVAAHYVGHLPGAERGAAFAAMAQAVRPGGTVVTIEHRWHRWPETGSLRLAARRGAGFTEMRFYRRYAARGEG
jgi:SAM-dependent methyltransferase